LVAGLAGFGTAGCSSSAPLRAEILVVIDTDAHLVGELASRPDVSADAAIDSLRIDVLDASNDVYATNLLLVADSSSWPVSFGVVPVNASEEVRLRVRAFRARFARPGSANGVPTFDPFPEVTLDRLVWLSAPAEGLSTVEVTLRYDCLGVAPSLKSPPSVCVDGAHPDGGPTDGIAILPKGAIPPSQAGTWSGALERPCASVEEGGAICIPGGFSVLGDYSAVGGPNATADQEPVPLHPVVVDPFWLDRDEFTVGRARSLVLAGQLPESMLQAMTPDDPLNQYCTWLGPDDSTNDELPLNCTTYDVALLACQLSQGTLPTEAQWLHAARGRGDGLEYPWGNEDPACCTLSASREAAFAASPECDGGGVEPVASHPLGGSCGGLGDVSKDGVNDLAGSVTEVLLDDFQSYSSACWGQGILENPVCRISMSGGPHVAHGGSWSTPLSDGLLAPRGYADDGPDFGFRCAFSDSSP
jgi:formylglycine-generating enzyme required for sulfatase activity